MITIVYLTALVLFVVAIMVANSEDVPFIFFWGMVFFLLALAIYA